MMRGLNIALAHENEASSMQFENLPASVGQWHSVREDLTWHRHIERDEERYHLMVFKDARESLAWNYLVAKSGMFPGSVVIAEGQNSDFERCRSEANAAADIALAGGMRIVPLSA